MPPGKNCFLTPLRELLQVTTFVHMKLHVTKTGDGKGKGLNLRVTKKAPADRPARGFIECGDISLKVFTNENFQIAGFEVTLGDSVKKVEKDSPFIMWSEVENAIEAYLHSKENAVEVSPLKGLGAVKKRRGK